MTVDSQVRGYLAAELGEVVGRAAANHSSSHYHNPLSLHPQTSSLSETKPLFLQTSYKCRNNNCVRVLISDGGCIHLHHVTKINFRLNNLALTAGEAQQQLLVQLELSPGRGHEPSREHRGPPHRD